MFLACFSDHPGSFARASIINPIQCVYVLYRESLPYHTTAIALSIHVAQRDGLVLDGLDTHIHNQTTPFADVPASNNPFITASAPDRFPGPWSLDPFRKRGRKFSAGIS